LRKPAISDNGCKTAIAETGTVEILGGTPMDDNAT
jgi:hypothetical protein